MRFYVVFILIGLLIGCQSQTYDPRQDWIIEMEGVIAEYEKTAKVERTKTILENGNESDVEFYSKDSNGLQKVKSYYLDEELSIDFTLELFLKNNMIILEKWSGLMPLLYKGEKRETDPCCELFNRHIYFKSSSEGKIYVKQQVVYDIKNVKIYNEDLKLKPLVEDKEYNIPNEYERAINYLKELE